MNSLKKLSIVFSTFILAYFCEIALNVACGPEPDPYDYYVSYFQNNTAGNGYEPFSFTELSFLYDEEEPQSESKINSEEWAQYLGKKVTPSDVYAVMYATDSATDGFIDDYLTQKKPALPDSLLGNTYLKSLQEKEQAKQYYLFSKQAELYAVVSLSSTTDYWDPESRDTASMINLANRAITAANNKNQDNFLRLRLAYQALRMYHYAGAYLKCLAVYDEFFNNLHNKTALRGWALALKAGAERRMGNNAAAAYHFSQVFAANPERRVQAYKNYHYINIPEKDVLALAKNNEEKAAIKAIEGFNNENFDYNTLAEVYSLAPKSILTGVLLTREINKLENYLTEASPYYDQGWWTNYGRPDSALTLARKHAENVARFSHQLSADKKYSQPALGVIAEAYLKWLLHDEEGSRKILSTLDPEKLNQRLCDQYHIVDLLLQIQTIQTADQIASQYLLPTLEWLDKKRLAEVDVAEKDMRFSRVATNIYQSVLTPHFLKLKDTVMAALMMKKGDIPRLGFSLSSEEFWEEQLQPKALEKLGKWADKGINNPWSGLLKKELDSLKTDKYYDLLGTAYLRIHDYSAALRAFNKLSKKYPTSYIVDWYSNPQEDTLYVKPFIASINDYPKEWGNVPENKISFAKKMVDLEQHIKKDPAHASKYYFQMANGVYQTGAYGNAWSLISYSWTSSDNYIKGNYYYAADFHEARQASKWYEMARKLSSNKEFKATCTFMLAKCEQKLYTYPTIAAYYDQWLNQDNKPDPFWLYSLQNKYFKELKLKYHETKFYKEALESCSYLADFEYKN
ncbi:hypothetical protein SAMN05216436_103225 [bacterium A37T11]|nr:hypothetical protein SAMN05216436_103225 [bacterium A37T11]